MTSQTPPPMPPPVHPPLRPRPPIRKRDSWWDRNWKWFVPVGCLGTIVILAAFAALIMGVVFKLMKSSDAYALALDAARSDPAVVAALGEPIEAGMMVTGKIHTSGASGRAKLAIPLSGPDGEGTLYVEATKRAGQWEFETLVVVISKTGRRIDLLVDVEAAALRGRPLRWAQLPLQDIATTVLLA